MLAFVLQKTITKPSKVRANSGTGHFYVHVSQLMLFTFANVVHLLFHR